MQHAIDGTAAPISEAPPPQVAHRSRASALRDWLFAPTSVIPLVVFRVAFGLLMFASTLRFLLRGWVGEFYIAPGFHFSYLGFGWVQPAPGNWMFVIFVGLLLLTACITLGLFYRVSMALFFVTFTYVELLDKALYLNHYYFISMLSFLLIFVPLHRAFSVDALLLPSIRTTTVPRWTVWAVRWQLGIVYVFAGMAKLQPDWMLRALPLKIWLPAQTDFPLIGRYFTETWVAFAFSWAGAFYDLTIPFWLSVRWIRPVAYLAVIAFHVMTGLMFPIGMFPWVMIAATLIFFDARDWRLLYTGLRRVLRFLPRWASVTLDPAAMPQARPWGRRLLLAGLALFLGVQMLLPWRYLLYPGDLLWTQEGFRFSWRVMLVESAGFTTFFVHDPQTGRRWDIYPDAWLTTTQERQMAFQPDMLHEFALYIEDRFRREGIADDVEVRVEAWVTYNGRPSRLLIDPDVDLTQHDMSIWHKPFILDYGERAG